MGMLHRLAEEHHSTYAHHRLGCIYHGLWPPSGPVVEKSAKQAISHYRVTAEMPIESLLNCPACKAKPLGMLCPFDCTSKLGQVSESSYNLACLAAVAGAQDEAFEWLAKAVATGFDKRRRRDAGRRARERRLPPRVRRAAQEDARQEADRPEVSGNNISGKRRGPVTDGVIDR